MSGLKIYGVSQSRAFRTYWMAEELGLNYDSEPIHFASDDRKSDSYLKINPNGRIPAIDDNGLQLFESMAINLYLARKHGGDLQPKTLEDEARATQWSFWVMTEVEKPLLTALFNLAILPEDQRDATAADKAITELQAPLAVLDKALASSEYLLGGGFTVADLNVASVLSWARMAKIDLSNFSSVDAWLGRCLSRPAAQR